MSDLKFKYSGTLVHGFLFYLGVCIQAHDRGLPPKGSINCAGYKVLISMEKYLELLDTSLPGKIIFLTGSFNFARNVAGGVNYG